MSQSVAVVELDILGHTEQLALHERFASKDSHAFFAGSRQNFLLAAVITKVKVNKNRIRNSQLRSASDTWIRPKRYQPRKPDQPFLFSALEYYG